MKITTYPDEERSVLGSMLLSKDLAYKAIQELTLAHFSDPVNELIFNLMRKIYTSGHALTKEALRVEALENDKYEKHRNDIVLIHTYAEIQNFDLYLEKIKDSYHKRRIAEFIRKMSKDLDSSSIYDIAKVCDEYLNESTEKTSYYIEDILENFEDGQSYLDVLQKRQERYNAGIRISGIPTGLPDLDDAIKGLNKGHYIALAGTPGSGKTSLAVQIIKNLEKQNVTVGVLSLELSNNQLIEKLISSETGLSYSQLLCGDIQGVNFQNCVDAVMPRLQEKKKKLVVEELPINSIAALENRVKRLIEVMGVQVLVIDYISLIDSGDKGSTITEKLSKISICIKNLLKKYKIPGIVLCQLVKSVENAPPDKHHIKDTSQIIQDAFEILMLWDPDPEYQGNGARKRVLFVRKARFGAPAALNYMFDGSNFISSRIYNQQTENLIRNLNDEDFGDFEV